MKYKKKTKWYLSVKFIMVALSIYFIFNIISLEVDIKHKNQELNYIREKCQRQLDDNKEQESLINVESDNEYIKRMAHEKLDYVEPEERVFIDVSCK